jgi:hypothetical protein
MHYMLDFYGNRTCSDVSQMLSHSLALPYFIEVLPQSDCLLLDKHGVTPRLLIRERQMQKLPVAEPLVSWSNWGATVPNIAQARYYRMALDSTDPITIAKSASLYDPYKFLEPLARISHKISREDRVTDCSNSPKGCEKCGLEPQQKQQEIQTPVIPGPVEVLSNVIPSQEIVSKVDLTSKRAIQDTEDLLAAINRTWQQQEAGQALRKILTGKAGIRQYPLDQLYEQDSAVLIALLRPFTSYYKTAHAEGPASLALAKEIIKRVIHACHVTWDTKTGDKTRELLPQLFKSRDQSRSCAQFLAESCFEKDHLLPAELGFIEYGSKQLAPLLAFRDFFFTYTIEELTLLHKNPSLILKETESVSSTVPTYFIRVINGVPFVHALMIQKQGTSIIAIGRDSKDIALTRLRTILPDIQPAADAIPLSVDQCSKLLQASKNKEKDFYLFTSYMIASYSRQGGSGAFTTSSSSSLARTGEKTDRVPALLPGMIQSSSGLARKASDTPAENPSTGKTKEVIKTAQKKSSLFIPKQAKPSSTLPNVTLPKAGASSVDAAITSLDDLLARFEAKAQEKLQSIVAQQELYSDETLLAKTKTLREKLKNRTRLTPELISFANPILKKYQQEGVAWLLNLYSQRLGGILASDPGLGKTLQGIEFIHQLHRLDPAGKPVCIIVPNSLAMQWEKNLQNDLFSAKLNHIKALLTLPDKVVQGVNQGVKALVLQIKSFWCYF